MLAGCMVMVRCEYLTQFDLAFKAMPDAIYNAKSFE